MIEIAITPEMREIAIRKAAELPPLRNSILKGDGNIAAFIGEQIAAQMLNAQSQNTYQFDVVSPNGLRIEVKTVRVSSEPKPDYVCTVAASSRKQECDYYAFTRVHKSLNKGWFLGVYPRDQFFEDAVFQKRGDLEPSNGFICRADCYNVKIKDLKQL